MHREVPFLHPLGRDCPAAAIEGKYAAKHRCHARKSLHCGAIGESSAYIAIAISASLPIVADRDDVSEGEGSRKCSGSDIFIRVFENSQRTVVKNICAPLLPMSIKVCGIFR